MELAFPPAPAVPGNVRQVGENFTPTSIRLGLVPRVVYFPEAFLARIETRPGALVELLTIALSAHLKGGGQ